MSTVLKANFVRVEITEERNFFHSTNITAEKESVTDN